MPQQRLCTRAYWEFRDLMKDIKTALCNYSPEWEDLIVDSSLYEPKCVVEGVCHERYSCGRVPKADK
jgi:thymidylate synthase (FAD)